MGYCSGRWNGFEKENVDETPISRHLFQFHDHRAIFRRLDNGRLTCMIHDPRSNVKVPEISGKVVTLSVICSVSDL